MEGEGKGRKKKGGRGEGRQGNEGEDKGKGGKKGEGKGRKGKERKGKKRKEKKRAIAVIHITRSREREVRELLKQGWSYSYSGLSYEDQNALL